MMAENFFKIYDDMIKTLHLSGNKLLVYAIIFSYTENNQTLFASQENIAKRIGVTRQTVNHCIKYLKEQEFIEETKSEKGTAYVSKKLTHDVKKIDSELSKKMTRCVKKFDTPLYTKSDNKNDIQKYRVAAPSYDIEKYNKYIEKLDLKYKK